MLVLVRPPYADYLGDRLFRRPDKQGDHWLHPFTALREQLEAQVVEVHTIDQRPPADADVILFVDLPSNREEVEKIARSAPKAKLLLQIIETPLGRGHFLYPPNHASFDAVITYDRRLLELNAPGRRPRYYHYDLCVTRPERPIPFVPFADRKPLVMVNSNRFAQFWLHSRSAKGLRGLPHLGPYFSGWKLSPELLLSPAAGELYSSRRRLARTAEQYPPGTFDIYGPGWQGEKMSLYHRLFGHRPYGCAKGKPTVHKYELLPQYRFNLAYENKRGADGYVSEKIFDALLCGTVPIYLGEEHIERYVPAGCFIDARRFRSPAELLDFVVTCDEPTWRRHYEAGQRFVASPDFDRFLPAAMTRVVSDAILEAAAVPSGGR